MDSWKRVNTPFDNEDVVDAKNLECYEFIRGCTGRVILNNYIITHWTSDVLFQALVKDNIQNIFCFMNIFENKLKICVYLTNPLIYLKLLLMVFVQFSIFDSKSLVKMYLQVVNFCVVHSDHFSKLENISSVVWMWTLSAVRTVWSLTWWSTVVISWPKVLWWFKLRNLIRDILNLCILNSLLSLQICNIIFQILNSAFLRVLIWLIFFNLSSFFT